MEMRGASQRRGLVCDDGEGMKESEKFWVGQFQEAGAIL